MKILADQRWCGEHGIGRYATEILTHIQTMPVDEVGSSSSPKDPWFLRKQIKKYQSDLFYSPGYNPPAKCDTPFIFTLHDLMHIDIAEESSLAKKLYFQFVIKPAVHRALKVLTVSEYSKKRIVEWSDVNPDKVSVTYVGVDVDKFSPKGPIYQHPRPYFFYCGNHRPHKNLKRVIQAFSALDMDCDFIFSGKEDESLKALASELGVGERVMFTGFIEETVLPDYFRGAKAIIVPSTCEGFGIPALEGLSVGKPVVTSDVTAIPEVVGNQAILVDPFSVESIRDGMAVTAEVPDFLDSRIEQAKKYEWKYLIERMKTIFEDVQK